MTERHNRREEIIETAAKLFGERGYAAVSVRDIADAVGCQQSALYYHFKDKRALLQAVMKVQKPPFEQAVEDCRDAASLTDLLIRFSHSMQVNAAVDHGARMRWLIAEYPTFDADERAIIHEMFVRFHSSLVAIALRFLPDEATVAALMWTLLCAVIGYGQVFRALELESAVGYQGENMTRTLAGLLASLQTSNQ